LLDYIFCNLYKYIKKDSENLNDSEDINRAWEKMKKNIKTTGEECLGVYELKQQKPWFDECLDFCIKWSRLKCSG
jgi:hypothetical protein